MRIARLLTPVLITSFIYIINNIIDTYIPISLVLPSPQAISCIIDTLFLMI